MTQFLPNWKTLSATALLAASVFTTQAQTPTERTCSAVQVMEQNIKANPSLVQQMKSIEAQTARFAQNAQSANAQATVYKIPVVVHVLYTNSTENISASQIQSQITVLNQDFRRTNPDRTTKWSQAADSEIEFVLASVDPSGNATNGITRTSISTSTWNIDQANDAMKFSNSGGKNAWPTSDYLNMWIVGGLTTNQGQTILGYAQFPGSGSASTDGVVMAHRYFGTTGTAQAPFDGGRTTTHEVGHWLNLRHIWGDGGCSVDDGVSDTPVSDAPNYGCPTGHVSCSTEDMVQNYMDYSDDGCMNLFTAGQKTRMRALFGSGGFRASLLSSGGLGGGSTPPPTGCSTNEVTVSITTDNYGSETSWTLKNSSGQTVGSGSGYGNNTTYTSTLCLGNGTYTFTINDSYGDGICCSYGNGAYSVKQGSTTLASGGSFTSSENKTITLGSSTPAPTCPALNFGSYSITGYSNQDAGSSAVQDGGATLYISGNSWKAIPYNYTITSNTVIEFEFRSTRQGEIQGISLENDNTISSDRTFHVYGSQNWGIRNYDNYSGTSWKSYTIPVGNFFTGSMNKLVFVGDDDASRAQTSYFRNVKIYEGSCGGTRVADLRTNEAQILGNDGEFSAMAAYPNPTNGSLTVDMPIAARASMHDVTGKVVWTGNLAKGANEGINISNLSNGIYMLKAVSADGQTYVQRLVKK